ncbi:adenylate kinase [Cylindrospermopsis raciborskii S07]|uniref:Adenylate kinase n=3 Tax=Cylindrospermopsis raciborskii TaxID=77022 RepID=A0A853MAV5_9CYAN|nr:adenylate kinase [Cylindrospermopsis raciborskii]MCH4904127.1 adenylate kinase [Cylindrospermopsis raciborskii CHAB3438]EFA70177.1 Adenylate kinase, subfamily [Cylindrospermopsis raciborskii CS-505]MEB3147076.1 adenylate kinase [Cylindrospermopsis raciborskii]OBU76560.1 adenylate kinase [Cylindrospermopsis raciborskii CS-505]OHY35938.1 adenylate kinase [Cylindrospermopsis raciborskii CS-508]
MTRLIFLGPPGAGKGTQAKVLADFLQVPHISTGDILRQAITDQTALGVKAQEYMDKGDLVPDQLVQDMVEERLQKSDAQKGWILDGFPRTVSQAVFLGNLLDRIQGDSERVVNLDAPDEIVVSRLLGRGRKDDSEDVIRHRLNVYRRDTAPLIQYYGDRQKLLTVNGNQSQEEVTSALKMAITVLRK